jgi:hypothetical protein
MNTNNHDVFNVDGRTLEGSVKSVCFAADNEDGAFLEMEKARDSGRYRNLQMEAVDTTTGDTRRIFRMLRINERQGGNVRHRKQGI